MSLRFLTIPSRSVAAMCAASLCVVALCVGSWGCGTRQAASVPFPEAEEFSSLDVPAATTVLAVLTPVEKVAVLLNAGGQPAGELLLSGQPRTALWVQRKAALSGATHVVMKDSQVMGLLPGHTTDSYSTRCQEGYSSQSGGFPQQQRSRECVPKRQLRRGNTRRVMTSSYQLIRVPQEKWPALPKSLRPRAQQAERLPSGTQKP